MIVLENPGFDMVKCYSPEYRDEKEVVLCINEIDLEKYVLLSVLAPLGCCFKLFMRSFVFLKTLDGCNEPLSAKEIRSLQKFYRKIGLRNDGPLNAALGADAIDIILERRNLRCFLNYCLRQEEAFGEQAFYRNQRLELTEGEARALEMFGYYGSRPSMDILKLVKCLMNGKSILWLHDLLHDPEIEQAVACKINLHPMIGMPTPPVCAMNAYVLNCLKWPQFHRPALHAYATQDHFIFDGIAEGHRLSYRYELARYLSDLHARYPILLQTLTGETVDVFAHLEEWFPKWLFSDSNE